MLRTLVCAVLALALWAGGLQAQGSKDATKKDKPVTTDAKGMPAAMEPRIQPRRVQYSGIGHHLPFSHLATSLAERNRASR